MNLKPLNPLFIGFGKQAEEYAKVLAKNKIKIYGACVTNLFRRKKVFDKYKINNRFNNLNTALASKGYNSIFIFLPFNIIEKKIFKILKMSNVPIYSEKPIALSYKKINQIEQFVKKYKKKLYILYNRNHYKIFNIINNYTKKDNFILKAYIPEQITKTINKIDRNLKGNIRYHLTSHWLNFFFSIKKINKIKFVFKENNFFFFNKTNEILISLDGKGFISAILQSKNYILFLLTLEQLFIFKIKKKKVKFHKYYNESLDSKFKPGVENLIKFIKKNRFKSNISNIKILYKSLEKLNY